MDTKDSREAKLTLHCQEWDRDPAVEVITPSITVPQELEAEQPEAHSCLSELPKDPGKGGRQSHPTPVESLATCDLAVDTWASREATHREGNARKPRDAGNNWTESNEYLDREDQRTSTEEARTIAVPGDQNQGITQKDIAQESHYISQQDRDQGSVQGGRAEDGDP